MKSGFAAIVGRPNVGKSTLINALVGTKVAITSSRPQTTRNKIRGVVHGVDHQIVLVDTPGLHRPRTKLGERLNRLVEGTLREADVAVFVLDATQRVGPGDTLIAGRLTESKLPTIVVVNKVDIASEQQVMERLSQAAEWDFPAYVPLSAIDGDNLAPLVDEIVGFLPEGPAYFPPDMTSDQPELLVVGEIVREKFLERLREELPHSLAVFVEDIVDEDGLIRIHADVLVERRSQKGIVIGKGGNVLARSGAEARVELEALFGTKVMLELRVKVEPDWQQRPGSLDRMGF